MTRPCANNVRTCQSGSALPQSADDSQTKVSELLCQKTGLWNNSSLCICLWLTPTYHGMICVSGNGCTGDRVTHCYIWAVIEIQVSSALTSSLQRSVHTWEQFTSMDASLNHSLAAFQPLSFMIKAYSMCKSEERRGERQEKHFLWKNLRFVSSLTFFPVLPFFCYIVSHFISRTAWVCAAVVSTGILAYKY